MQELDFRLEAGQLGPRNTCTRIDETGIDAKIFTGLARRAAWADIENIRVRPRGNNEAVLVVLRSGQQFSMGAPFRSPLFPDPAFAAKFEQIVEAWRAHSVA
jgi:hypothetical protein